jgi:hypothetical protein
VTAAHHPGARALGKNGSFFYLDPVTLLFDVLVFFRAVPRRGLLLFRV